MLKDFRSPYNYFHLLCNDCVVSHLSKSSANWAVEHLDCEKNREYLEKNEKDP